MTNEVKQEFTFRISRANSTEMVVILYDIALYYLRESRERIEKKESDAEICKSIGLCKSAINELIKSLNLQYEPATSMRQLYLYSIRRLTIAEIKKDVEILAEVERIIRPLRDAYEEIAPNNTDGAVMGNSQEVYAGLTYGKSSLTENIQDQGSNRGFRV